MKKKILSLILVAAMLASMLVFAPVAGASEALATVDVTETAGFAGGKAMVEVIVQINALDGENPIQSFTGLIEYDRTRLSLAEAIRTDAFLQDPETDATSNNENTLFAPYVKDGWTSLSGFNGQDATEGLVAFTLTFDILADAPAGDAYVKFHHIDGGASEITYDSVVAHILNKKEQINYLDGKVTVLDGYAPAMDPADFVIEDLGEGNCKIVEYLGNAAVLNIPSEINGLTVVEIGSMILCEVNRDDNYVSLSDDGILENNKITTIVIPETVKTINEYAFINANFCSTIIVLGDALDSVDGTAFGFTGNTWNSLSAKKNKGKFNDDGWPDTILDENEWEVVTNVKLMLMNEDALGAGFAAACASTKLIFPTEIIGAYSKISTTVDGETTTYVAFGDSFKAPLSIDGDATLVAWTDAEGNVYAPGADIGDATELTAVTVEAPVTNKGVTAKITNEFAMRFQATISKATYDAMAELGEVTMGMLITPRQYVVKAGNVFTMEALDALVAGKGFAGYVRVDVQNPYSANAETFEECTEFTIAGSITGLKDSTAAKDPDFVSVGFLQVTLASGDVVTVYGDYDYTSAMKVSTFLATIDDVKAEAEGWGNTQKGWINTWKELFGQTLLTVDEELDEE